MCMSVGSFLGNALRRGRTLWLILVALLAAYAVMGFFILPLVIKAQGADPAGGGGATRMRPRPDPAGPAADVTAGTTRGRPAAPPPR